MQTQSHYYTETLAYVMQWGSAGQTLLSKSLKKVRNFETNVIFGVTGHLVPHV